MSASFELPAQEVVDEQLVAGLTVDGFSELEPRQRLALYHLCQAGLEGDRIAFEQTGRDHLAITFLMEDVLEHAGPQLGDVIDRMADYLKRLYMHHGNHKQDSGTKFLPDFSPDELAKVADSAAHRGGLPSLPAHVTLRTWLETLQRPIFDGDYEPHSIIKSPPDGHDVVTAACVSFYQGLTEDEVRAFHGAHALNSNLVKGPNGIEERVWRAGGEGAAPGLYAPHMQRMIAAIEAAYPYLEPVQVHYYQALVSHFRTGDAEAFREYNRRWIPTDCEVDGIIGFIEQYADPMGLRGSYEGSIFFVDREHGRLMKTLAEQAHHFEARMPWDDRWKRDNIRTTMANAMNMIGISGSTSPFGYSGVNLPNEARLRETAGSKSLLVSNIPRVRRTLLGDAVIREFCPDQEGLDRSKRYGRVVWEVMVALHEVVGHASGRLAPDLEGGPEEHLREYFQTLEEARADLVALWHMFDPRLVELGILPDAHAADEVLWMALRNALGTIGRLESPSVEEDHQRGELLIVNYLRDRTHGVAEFERDGKVYWAVRDIGELRRGVGDLLTEIMRIKAVGDYPAIRALVEKYGARVHPELHRSCRERVHKLNVPERLVFIAPELKPIFDHNGRAVDVTLSYPPNLLTAQRAVSNRYRAALAR